jgi:hypothetical protein
MGHQFMDSVFVIIRSTAPLFRGEPYLDPGSGSFLIQVLIATLLGGAFILRSYWGKLLGFFRRVLGKNTENPQDDEK